MIAFGSLALANPALPARFAQQGPFNQPDQATMYNGGVQGYTDYSTLAQESAPDTVN